jgi:antitoxin (DNA-binding transcriptional repressor) of toxin-antitoxin stability system
VRFWRFLLQAEHRSVSSGSWNDARPVAKQIMTKYYGHNSSMKDIPMRTVSVAQAKAQLPSLLQAAEAGERVLITRHGKAVAEVRAVSGIDIDPADPHGLKWLAEQRKKLPMMTTDSATLIREMRDEGDH